MLGSSCSSSDTPIRVSIVVYRMSADLIVEFGGLRLSPDAVDVVNINEHLVEDEDLPEHLRSALLLAVEFKPSVTCYYKAMVQCGVFPLGQDSAIEKLVMEDRGRFEAGIAAIRAQVSPTHSPIVTKIEDVLTALPVLPPHIAILEGGPPYDPTIASAYLHPLVEPGRVQISSQFTSPIIVADDNKSVTFQLKLSGKEDKRVVVSGAEIYNAFRTKCKETKKFLGVVSKLLDVYVHARADITTTRYAGHKVLVKSENGDSKVMFYLLRHETRHRKGVKNQLKIVAVDIQAEMPGTVNDRDDECYICFGALDDTPWTCCHCLNKLHSSCAARWLKKHNVCPVCREAPL